MPGSENVQIRPFRSRDTDRIIEITRQVFGPYSIDALIEKHLGRFGAGWQDIKADEVRRELKASPESCFVAVESDRVVGYVTTAVNRSASRGWIANLAVSADCQSSGIGRQLLAHAIDFFRGESLALAKIETLACNEAGRHLYPSLGFQEVVRQIHYAMKL